MPTWSTIQAQRMIRQGGLAWNPTAPAARYWDGQCWRRDPAEAGAAESDPVRSEASAGAGLRGIIGPWLSQRSRLAH